MFGQYNPFDSSFSLLSYPRGIISPYGASLTPPPIYLPNKINVRFTATINPYSLFFVKYVDRAYVPVGPHATVNSVTNYQNTKQSQAEILVTNGDLKVFNGTILDCDIIGFDTPVKLRYTSTAPDLGDRLRPSKTGNTVFKHSAGELVAVSKPDTARLHIWVIRARKKDKIYGKTTASVSYGPTNSVTVNIWRNLAVTNPLETETVFFNWVGITGQTIPSGTKIEAEFWDDMSNGDGAYRISNSNCVAS